MRDHADINGASVLQAFLLSSGDNMPSTGQQLLEYTNALDGVERTTQLLQWVNMTFALTAYVTDFVSDK